MKMSGGDGGGKPCPPGLQAVIDTHREARELWNEGYRAAAYQRLWDLGNIRVGGPPTGTRYPFVSNQADADRLAMELTRDPSVDRVEVTFCPEQGQLVIEYQPIFPKNAPVCKVKAAEERAGVRLFELIEARFTSSKTDWVILLFGHRSSKPEEELWMADGRPDRIANLVDVAGVGVKPTEFSLFPTLHYTNVACTKKPS